MGRKSTAREGHSVTPGPVAQAPESPSVSQSSTAEPAALDWQQLAQMEHLWVATLVAPEGGELAAQVVAQAHQLLRDQGATVDAPDWLAPRLACDLRFRGLAPVLAVQAVEQLLGEGLVDFAVQSREGRRKRLLIADLESTLIRNEMLDELGELAGVGQRVAEITARAMRGELDFRAALAERLALLAGQPESLLEQAWQRLVVNPGAAVLAATLQGHGVRMVIVSGGFDWFVRRVAAQLGVARWSANQLEVAGGRLTGRAVEPILDRTAKRQALESHAAELGISLAETAAVGDGANDLDLLGHAALGVAYRAKPAVARAARFRLDHADLTALLYFQGYRATELLPG